jgi:quinol monooxygenase YgiN
MIIRIVKMHFHANNRDAFEKIFAESAPKIRAFNGCSHVHLLNDINDNCRYFTYSHWENETALEDYRNSELFKTTWAKTKPLFDAPPEAWSTGQFEY